LFVAGNALVNTLVRLRHSHFDHLAIVDRFDQESGEHWVQILRNPAREIIGHSQVLENIPFGGYERVKFTDDVEVVRYVKESVEADSKTMERGGGRKVNNQPPSPPALPPPPAFNPPLLARTSTEATSNSAANMLHGLWNVNDESDVSDINNYDEVGERGMADIDEQVRVGGEERSEATREGSERSELQYTIS